MRTLLFIVLTSCFVFACKDHEDAEPIDYVVVTMYNPHDSIFDLCITPWLGQNTYDTIGPRTHKVLRAKAYHKVSVFMYCLPDTNVAAANPNDLKVKYGPAFRDTLFQGVTAGDTLKWSNLK